MSKNIYVTDKAPAPVGPYSQAVGCGNLLFCSGQIPLDPISGELILGDVQQQTKKVMENVAAVLENAGLSFSNVLKTTIFLTDMTDFNAVNEVYSTYFSENPPARSCVAVAALPKGVNVEIEVLAHK